MYGKIFASLWTGSMSGTGVIRQHVFCWMIANCDKEGYVEVNPRLLAAMFGPPATPDAITEALSWLALTDPLSRTKERDGQRIEHVDAFLWHLINYQSYRDQVKAADIREKTRERVQRFRERNAKEPVGNAEVTLRNAEVTPVRGQRSERIKTLCPKSPPPDPEAARLAALLLDLHAERDHGFKPALQREKTISAWGVEIERLIRIDKRPAEDVELVIRWVVTDSFWQTNIMSGATLRKQFDKLLPKMQQQRFPIRSRDEEIMAALKASVV